MSGMHFFGLSVRNDVFEWLNSLAMMNEWRAQVDRGNAERQFDGTKTLRICSMRSPPDPYLVGEFSLVQNYFNTINTIFLFEITFQIQKRPQKTVIRLRPQTTTTRGETTTHLTTVTMPPTLSFRLSIGCVASTLNTTVSVVSLNLTKIFTTRPWHPFIYFHYTAIPSFIILFILSGPLHSSRCYRNEYVKTFLWPPSRFCSWMLPEHAPLFMNHTNFTNHNLIRVLQTNIWKMFYDAVIYYPTNVERPV